MQQGRLYRATLGAICALTLPTTATSEELVVEGSALPARTIFVAENDLVSAQAVGQLKTQINRTARAVCKEMNFDHTGAHWTRRACVHWAEDDALRQLGLMIDRRPTMAAANGAQHVITVRAR